jgi:hypothetical protein
MSLDVHLNMSQSGNGLIPDHGKLRGNYTGERLKSLRPETYREVVRLLAEPREHVSIREICRRCHVTDDTVKAVERREAVPIAARKQELLVQAVRIAKRAYNRVEDEIDEAPLPQAVVTAGVFTDKLLLLNNDPTIRIEHDHTHHHRHDHFAEFNALLEKLPKEKPIEAEVVTDVELNPGMGLESQTEIPKNG